MLPSERLRDKLLVLEGKGYGDYRTIAGAYRFPTYVIHVDHVQGDPFAPPSLIRVRMDMAECQFPLDLFRTRVRRIALEDFIARSVHAAIRHAVRGHRGTGRSGMITVDAGGQEILERTACTVAEDWVEVRLAMGLPADGRRIKGKEAIAMFFEEIPRVVEHSLVAQNLSAEAMRRHVEVAEDHDALRTQLGEHALVAFVADGALLPRESGASDRPLRSGRAVRFAAPDALRVMLQAPNRGAVTGMGIPRGVTLIVGGGFHGKSTLLQALQRGVYPHVPGDGRECVVTVADAVEIRAEDGRRVEKVDISAFIGRLPHGGDTTAFSTDNASGSTSQAANIVEALEAGASLLLMDEDTCATNFMIRDALMQRLVPREKEPITPFVDRVRELYEAYGVSTILAMGGSGDYLEVADVVIMMDHYQPRVVTDDARRIAAERRDRRAVEAAGVMEGARPRIPLAGSFNPFRGRKIRVESRGPRTLQFGREVVDLSALEHLVDESQTRAIGDAILHAVDQEYFGGERTLAEVLERLEQDVDGRGLGVLSPFKEGHPGDYARPRRQEIAAVINRLRTLAVRRRGEVVVSMPAEVAGEPTEVPAELGEVAMGPEEAATEPGEVVAAWEVPTGIGASESAAATKGEAVIVPEDMASEESAPEETAPEATTPATPAVPPVAPPPAEAATEGSAAVSGEPAASPCELAGTARESVTDEAAAREPAAAPPAVSSGAPAEPAARPAGALARADQWIVSVPEPQPPPDPEPRPESEPCQAPVDTPEPPVGTPQPWKSSAGEVPSPTGPNDRGASDEDHGPDDAAAPQHEPVASDAAAAGEGETPPKPSA